MAEITREQVVDYLSNLPVIQIAELVNRSKINGVLAPRQSPLRQLGPRRQRQ